MRVRREERRGGRAAVEGEPQTRLTENRVAGLLEHREPGRRLGEFELWGEVERSVVEERRFTIRALQPGSETPHPLDRLVEPACLRRGAHLEQVTEDNEVVDGTALVVATVRENLLGELATEQRQSALERAGVSECAAPEDERACIANHVVAQYVVLDVPLQIGELPREALRE